MTPILIAIAACAYLTGVVATWALCAGASQADHRLEKARDGWGQ